jgi:hypothetical protein
MSAAELFRKPIVSPIVTQLSSEDGIGNCGAHEPTDEIALKPPGRAAQCDVRPMHVDERIRRLIEGDVQIEMLCPPSSCKCPRTGRRSSQSPA